MKSNFSSEQEFIITIAESAQKACKRYGYLPSVLIAQSCLENGYGIPAYWDNSQIKLLLQYNNMIGQKAELLNSSWYDKTVWTGKSFNKNTPEIYSNQKTIIKDNFRIFDDIEQSFCDFILFLLYASNYGYNQTPKYGKEIVKLKDPFSLITEVNNRGYTTNKNYPNSVMKIITKHNLIKYDDLSNIRESIYIPDSLIQSKGDRKMKITERTIKDITAENLSQIPALREQNPIEWIVIHYLGVANADNPYLYSSNGTKGYGGHYYVSRAGQIFKAANPKTAVVWQCGGNLQGPNGHQYHRICNNYNSIGIENGVCYDGTWYFTTETQESLIFLVATLMDEYHIDINHVIRHFDVTGKICPAPYVNNDKHKTSLTWDEFKAELSKYYNSEEFREYIKNSKPYVQIPDYPALPFSIKILIDDLNMRQGPDTSYASNGYIQKGTYTIVDVIKDWGKLKSGAGWIYLGNPDYCSIIGEKTIRYLYNKLDYSPVFDYHYYMDKYPDLKNAFGDNASLLFNHFCTNGMKQGRQGISSFNVILYKNNYKDLQKSFGSNLPLYYKHYIEYGKKEGRTKV